MDNAIRWFLMLVCASACGPVTGTPPPLVPPDDGRSIVVEARSNRISNLDLLFVIDDSGSMSDKQQSLATSLPRFVDTLANTQFGLPDLHVGMISTDMGTTGSEGIGAGLGTVGQGGCDGSGKNGSLLLGQATGIAGTFLTDITLTDGTRQKNYPLDLATTLGDMTKLGATGCGFEQPLHAMRRALDENPANAGFVRRDALLAVVFLTDEDDCSIRDPALLGPNSTSNPLQSFRCMRFGVTCADGGNTPDEMNELGEKGRCGPNTSPTALLDDPAQFRDFLVDLKGDPNRVVVSGIIGDAGSVSVEPRVINGQTESAVAHTCARPGADGVPNTVDDSVADPGVRMQSFLDSFPDRNTSTSICEDDFSDGLEATAHLISQAAGSSCLSKPLLDVDPAPGFQADCVVEQVVGTSVTEMFPCGNIETPLCWRLVSDASECPWFDNLKLEVIRPNASFDGEIVRARCRVE